MAYYRITADESGKLQSKSEYTSFCGYIALAKEWERFEVEWDSCRMKLQVPPIHMAAIMCPDRDEDWMKIKASSGESWDDRRDHILREFSAIIRHAELLCVGAVVDAGYFRSMPDSAYKKGSKDPIFLSLQTMVMDAIDKTDILSTEYPISLVVDDDQQFAMECYKWLNVLKQISEKARRRLSSICFVDDVVYPGVQAADMIAYESRRLMVERKRDPACKPSRMFLDLTSDLSYQPRLITASVLDELNGSVV